MRSNKNSAAPLWLALAVIASVSLTASANDGVGVRCSDKLYVLEIPNMDDDTFGRLSSPVHTVLSDDETDYASVNCSTGCLTGTSGSSCTYIGLVGVGAAESAFDTAVAGWWVQVDAGATSPPTPDGTTHKPCGSEVWLVGVDGPAETQKSPIEREDENGNTVEGVRHRIVEIDPQTGEETGTWAQMDCWDEPGGKVGDGDTGGTPGDAISICCNCDPENVPEECQ